MTSEERKASKKRYYELHKTEILAKNKIYRETHKVEVTANKKVWAAEHKEELKIKNKIYAATHKEEIAIKNKKWRKEHEAELKIKDKAYYETNKKEIAARQKIYRETHKAERCIKNKIRLETDAVYKSAVIIRGLIGNSIRSKGFKKNTKTEKILSCPLPFFKEYIEKQFKPGMTWFNHGEWHLDHKVPLALAKTEQETIKLNHYSNFQPLWKEDNLNKFDNLLPEFRELAIQLLGREDF